MSDDPDILALREQLKSREIERTELIELGRVNDYLQALDQPTITANDPVPPLFLLTLARRRRPQPSGGGVNMGNEFEFKIPLRIGDAITSSAKAKDFQSRHGKRGK